MIDHDIKQTDSDTNATVPTTPPWTLRLMQMHFALFGLTLLLGAVSLATLVYQDFDRIRLGFDLRIDNPGDIYMRDTQIYLFLTVSLSLLSLLPFRTVAGLMRHYRSTIVPARLVAGLLLVGIPMAGFMALYMNNLPAERADMSTVQQFIDELAAVVSLAVALLALQSGLALWYQLWLSRSDTRRLLSTNEPPRFKVLKRGLTIGLGLGFVTMVGMAIILGVLTDWLYERSIPRPAPGEPLYATSFDTFNEEWDLYGGRDTAEVLDSKTASFVSDGLAGNVLSIRYGTGLADGIVWSVLTRKFNDFDLRVTAQLVDGPFDQNKYGVIFRYKDTDNFYYFGLTADGYYGLLKVTDGVIQEVSQWGFSDLIVLDKPAHEIRIVAHEDSFRFWVDSVLMPLCLPGENEFSMWQSPGVCWEGGELTTVFRDETFKQGRIALAVGTWDGSPIQVAFDDLLIVGPAPLDDDTIDPIAE